MMMNFNYYMMCLNNFLPLMLSLNLMNFFISLMFILSNFKLSNLIISLIILTMNVVMWFMYMMVDYDFSGSESLNLEKSMKLFFMFFIVSEIMIFISMFWSYYSYFMVMDMNLGFHFPSFLLKKFEWDTIPLINTFILVMSSVTMTSSHWFFFKNKINLMNLTLLMTIMLGLIFTMMQMMEYNSSFYGINDSNYGSLFFILTGLHGSHVLLGVITLIFSFFKSLKLNFFFSKSETFEMGSWYWHFVDLIWLFVFYSLYFIV